LNLFDFANVQVGMVLPRMFTSVFGGTCQEARVIDLSADTITCLVEVDSPTTMRFNRKSGVHELGPEYGFLVNRLLEPEDPLFADKMRNELIPALTLNECGEAESEVVRWLTAGATLIPTGT
jgi:hypothetical protein